MHKHILYNTMADGTNALPQEPTILKETKYKTIKGNTESTSTLKEVGRSLENKVQRVSNRLFYGVNGVTLSSDRAKRWIQGKVGVSDGALREKFANVYEWEEKNPKKTKAISSIEVAQEDLRKDMNNKTRSVEDRTVSSVSQMIMEVIKNILFGAKPKDAINYHNTQHPEYQIANDEKMQNMIRAMFSSVAKDINNKGFDFNNIANNKNFKDLSSIINSANNGKNAQQLEAKLNRTEDKLKNNEYLAKKEGLQAVGDVLQQRKKLEKHLENTKINRLSDTTTHQQETSAKKIAQYEKDLKEIDGQMAENTENNIKNDQERDDSSKGDIKEAKSDLKAVEKVSIESDGALAISGEKLEKDIETNKKLSAGTGLVQDQKELDDSKIKQSEDAIRLSDAQNRVEVPNKKDDLKKTIDLKDMSADGVSQAPINLTQQPLGGVPAPATKGQAPAQVSTTGASTKVVSNGEIPNKNGEIQKSDQTKTVANEPKTKFQKQQAKIELAKAALVEKNKQKGLSVRADRKKNKEKIAENKKPKTKSDTPMNNDIAFGSTVPQKKSSQQGYIKNKQNNIGSSAPTMSDAKGGAKGPVTSAVVKNGIQAGKGI